MTSCDMSMVPGLFTPILAKQKKGRRKGSGQVFLIQKT
jgi:hypothetical protein